MGLFKAVFLDVGGTLLRMGDPAAAYCEILTRHGYDLERERISQALAEAREVARAVEAGPLPDLTIVHEREYARRDRMVCELLQRLGVERGFEACRLAIWDSWLGTRVFQAYPETAAVLARLKERGYVVGAVSNWEPRLEALCANHGLRDAFDFILASEAEGHVKPSPYLFEKALRLAGVEPAEAVHVGDSLREDAQAAETVGIAGVLLVREAEPPFGHSPAIRTLEELFPLLEASDWIRGEVVSGAGVAAGFTEVPWVREQTRERLGFVPYPGTLNLRLSSAEALAAWKRLKAGPGVPLEPQPGFCAGRCYPVLVEGWLRAAVVVPEVEGYPADSLELLAPVRLRDALGVEDGSLVTVVVP